MLELKVSVLWAEGDAAQILARVADGCHGRRQLLNTVPERQGIP